MSLKLSLFQMRGRKIDEGKPLVSPIFPLFSFCARRERFHLLTRLPSFEPFSSSLGPAFLESHEK